MNACYHCGLEFAAWPGAFQICPACFARRPARINRRVPGWRLRDGAPLALPEVRALFDLAEADRTRHPRQRSTVVPHRAGWRIELMERCSVCGCGGVTG